MITISPTGFDDVVNIQAVQTANIGKTIQFLAGNYIIGGSLVLTEHSFLEAGAIFILGQNAVLSIGNKFIASQTKHFDTAATGSKVVLGSVRGQNIICPEWWGAIPDDTSYTQMVINHKALQAAFDYATDAHSVMFDAEFATNAALRFNSGTGFNVSQARGVAGIRFKMDNSPSVSLLQPYTTGQRSVLDGLRLTVDAGSTFTSGARVKILNLLGGRWITAKNMQIDFFNDFLGVYKIGLEIKGTVANPSFNNSILENVINGCNTDLCLAGTSIDANGFDLEVGTVIRGNQLMSQTTVDWDINLRLDGCAGIMMSDNIFNQKGQTGTPSSPVGALNILTDDKCSGLMLSRDYYDGGKNGRRRIWVTPNTIDMRIEETMISAAEVYKQPGATGITFNGVAI